MSEFYIPPKELSFRLKNKKTGKVLFSREKSPGFGQFDGDSFADQWWQLVPGEGDYQGWYLVKSKFTGNVLFSRSAKTPYVDHTDGNGKWADQWFKLEPGTGDRHNWFRLLNTSTATVVVSGNGVTNAKADAATNDNQYWSFQFEDMEFVTIDYDLDNHKILGNKPSIVGSNTTQNMTNSVQTVKVAITVTTSNTSTFEHLYGITITGTVRGSYGVPVVALGEVEMSVAVKAEIKWGEQTTDTHSISLEVPATAEPHSEVTAVATATKSDIEVPFTTTWKSKQTGYQVKTKGVYRGTTYWDIKSKIKENPFGENRGLDLEDDSQGWEEVEPLSITEIPSGEQERSLEDEIIQDENNGFESNAQQGEYTEQPAYNEEQRYTQGEPEREDYEQEVNGKRKDEDNEYPSPYEEERDNGNQFENYCDNGDTEQNNGYERNNQYDAEREEEQNNNSRTYTENNENAPEDFAYDEQSSYNQRAEEEPRDTEQDERLQQNAGYEENSSFEAPQEEEQGYNGYRARQDNQEDEVDRYGEKQVSREYGRYDAVENEEAERPVREDGYADENPRSNWY